eukprot:NODE_789_length_4227_cov_0.325824.p2 type:complete len:241 gc:universal NODE_789_length_4227_cov_0.325824:2015-1293(-)
MICEGDCFLVFSQIFPILGNIAALALFFSPTVHSYKIFKSEELNGYNTLPNIFCALNCFSWSLYGIVQLNWYLIATNVLGFSLSIFNFLMTVGPIYKQSDENKILINSSIWLVSNMALLLYICSFCIISIQNVDTKQALMGWTCIFYLLIFYASPLQLLLRVMKERDSKYFYIPFVVTCLINATTWTIYGLAINDMFVALPNGFGILVALIQLLLCITFRNNSTAIREIEDIVDLLDEVR